MLGRQVWSLLGLKVILKLQLFSYVQASATHRETSSKKYITATGDVQLPKDCKRFRDESPQLHPRRLTPK